MIQGGGCGGSGACSCGPCLSVGAFVNAFPPNGFPGMGARAVSARGLKQDVDPFSVAPSRSELSAQSPGGRVRSSRVAGGGSSSRIASLPITSGSDHYTDPDEGREADLIDWALSTGEPQSLLDALDLIESWQSVPCERIAAPPRSEWDQDCLEYMKGGDWCWEPCLNQQSAEDFEALMDESFDSSRYYEITIYGEEYYDRDTTNVDATLEDVEDFLAAVWKLILANLDLLEWVGCMVQGTSRGSRVEVKGFEGKLSTGLVAVIVYMGERECALVEDSSYEGWWHLFGGGSIEVCAHVDEHFHNNLQIWVNGETTADRACAAIDVAASFCHEMTHVGGNAHEYREGECDLAQLIGSCMQWALLRRYSFTYGSRCCRRLFDDVSTSPGFDVRGTVFRGSDWSPSLVAGDAMPRSDQFGSNDDLGSRFTQCT